MKIYKLRVSVADYKGWEEEIFQYDVLDACDSYHTVYSKGRTMVINKSVLMLLNDDIHPEVFLFVVTVFCLEHQLDEARKLCTDQIKKKWPELKAKMEDSINKMDVLMLEK